MRTHHYSARSFRIALTLGLILVVAPATAQKDNGWTDTIFSPVALQEDIRYYRSRLETLHPNLYLYFSREACDRFFDSLLASINQPMTTGAFYSLICLSSSRIRDGHTLILPPSPLLELKNRKLPFLPYQLGIEQGRLLVRLRCTADTSIPEGAEIQAINGVRSADILQFLLDRQVRDGNNPAYALWILDQYFRDYYSFHFGNPREFVIRFKTGEGEKQVRVTALTRDSIIHYRSVFHPEIHFGPRPGEGLQLAIPAGQDYAVLRIRDFDNETLREEYRQSFKWFTRSAMDSLNRLAVANLIIDLRDNQGGDIGNAVFLLARLLDHRFRVLTGYQKLRAGKLVRSGGSALGWHRPVSNPYRGKIYVLVNGGSFSNSVIFSGCLRENNRAVFIGSETGGNPHVLGGDARGLVLPNTQLEVQVPTRRYLLTAIERNPGRGLVPEYEVKGIPGRDAALELALKLIHQ